MWNTDSTMNRQKKATWREWRLYRGMKKQRTKNCTASVVREKEIVFM